jgi:hypothetical protein
MVTHEKIEQLRDAAKPLQEFLRSAQCPHDIIIVREDRLDLFEARCGIPAGLSISREWVCLDHPGEIGNKA